MIYETLQFARFCVIPSTKVKFKLLVLSPEVLEFFFFTFLILRLLQAFPLPKTISFLPFPLLSFQMQRKNFVLCSDFLFPLITISVTATGTLFLQVESKYKTSLPLPLYFLLTTESLAIDLKTTGQMYMHI